MKALLVLPLGMYVVEIDGTLDQLQLAVGGLIESCRSWPSGEAAYCNEEGLLKNLTYNPYAHALCSYPLLGNVIVTGVNAAGETCAVSDAWLEIVQKTCTSLGMHYECKDGETIETVLRRTDEIYQAVMEEDVFPT